MFKCSFNRMSNIPVYWRTRLEEVEETLQLVNGGVVRMTYNSAGDRAIYLQAHIIIFEQVIREGLKRYVKAQKYNKTNNLYHNGSVLQ